MTGRCLVAAMAVVMLVSMVPGAAIGQTAASDSWTLARTADGHPDLQGTWANNRATPMQRPEQFGNKARLTDEELAELTSQIAAFRDSEQAGDLLGDRLIQQALGNAEFQDFDTVTGNYNAFWLVDRRLDNRTSLIIDPPNGRRPPQTETARARARGRFGSGRGAPTVPRTGGWVTAASTLPRPTWGPATTATFSCSRHRTR